MSVAEYDDVGLRFAGSLPDGTDVEYSPQYRVAPALGVVVADHAKELRYLRGQVDYLAEKVAYLERRLSFHLHEHADKEI